jgi:uncharacterized RDD family membrane protein YckC
MDIDLNKNEDLLHDTFLSSNVKASTGKRFANYIIDLIVFYILMAAFGVAWALISPETVGALDTEASGFGLLDRLISTIAFGIIMGLIEAISKGKSLGKLITGTRAVNEDGSTISFQTAMLRGICRAVPFDQLSALGSPSYPWHDRWTTTEVIDERASNFNIKNKL